MIKKRFKWNYDACYEVAKGCNKIIEFKKKNQVAYNVARKEGWIKDYNWFVPTKYLRHAPRPNRKKWTFEKCFELAKTCNTLAEFEHKYNACACISRKYGWINFFDWLKEQQKDLIQMATTFTLIFLVTNTRCMLEEQYIQTEEI